MANVVSFLPEDFQSFMSTMSILRANCNDISIVNGKIFQENNPKDILYDVDLSDIFGVNTMYMNGANSKINILDIFRKQHSRMELEITAKSYIWKDDQSKVNFIAPSVSTLDIKPLNENSTKSDIYRNYTVKIFEHEIDNTIIERIIHCQKSMETDAIYLIINGENARFHTRLGGNNGAVTKDLFVVDTLESYDYTGVAKFPMTPFIPGVERLNISTFINEQFKDRIILKTSTSIGKININVWSVMALKTKESKGT